LISLGTYLSSARTIKAEDFSLKRLRKLLKKQINPPPALIVTTGIFAVMLITAIGGIANYSSEINQKLSDIDSANSSPQTKITQAQEASQQTLSKDTSSQNSSNTTSSDDAPANKPGTDSVRTTESANSGTTPTSPSNPKVPKSISVNLSISGSFAGVVSVKSGSNYCQVLNDALAQGIIWKLDMRYNSQFGTYGVYVINNIGDANTVRLVYQVNGQSPPVGCTHLKAQNNDSVNWKES